MDALTDRAFWREFWKHHVEPPVRPGTVGAQLADLLPRRPCRFLEIGGFPGTFGAFVRVTLGHDVTLLDFHSDRLVVQRVEEQHGLAPGSLHLIEGDLTKVPPRPEFDVVYSNGFVEHFQDVQAILGLHAQWLVPGGALVVSVPNFLGVNGVVQRLYDPALFAVHNLDAMRPRRLEGWARGLGLKDVVVHHLGTPQTWLKHPEHLPWPHRMMLRNLNRVLARLPRALHKHDWLAPFTVLTARKEL